MGDSGELGCAAVRGARADVLATKLKAYPHGNGLQPNQ